MECPTALYIWGKFDVILKKIIRKDITPEEKIFGMKCSIIKSREHLRNYITFAIRHTIIISRAIEFDDPITAGNVLITKVKNLLKEDLERNYLMAIYNNRVENFKSVFLIDNILGRIEESENELQDGKLTLYFYTRDEDD